MRTIDLNCDMGESFGPWRMGNDAELMRHISSVNIACGFHAGDASTMRRTIELAIEHELAIGAHPGFPDLQGFGRRDMKMSAREVFDIVQYQVSALKGMCEARQVRLHHVKPHGALYNKAARDPELAAAIAEAVREIDPDLVLYGLSGSESIAQARALGLRAAAEVFADRTYDAAGNLSPRSVPGALITDAGTASAQAVRMIREGKVTSLDGRDVAIDADTICIHGDGTKALEFAVAVAEAIKALDIRIAAP